MSDPECIFCKIVAGEIPSQVIWADDNFLAFLDIFPLRLAQTVLIPKTHVPSSIFKLPDEIYHGLFTAAKAVAELLEIQLGAERVMVVGEGLEVPHAHLKLYPRFLHEGGLVNAGEQADVGQLASLGEKIRG